MHYSQRAWVNYTALIVAKAPIYFKGILYLTGKCIISSVTRDVYVCVEKYMEIGRNDISLTNRYSKYIKVQMEYLWDMRRTLLMMPHLSGYEIYSQQYKCNPLKALCALFAVTGALCKLLVFETISVFYWYLLLSVAIHS